MPKRNYDDLQPDYLAGYWSQKKDILAVTNFGDLVPEVIHLGDKCHKVLTTLSSKRIEYKLRKMEEDESRLTNLQSEIIQMKHDIRRVAEKTIVDRLYAIRRFVRQEQGNPDLSMDEIFQDKSKDSSRLISPLKNLLKRGPVNDLRSSITNLGIFRKDKS